VYYLQLELVGLDRDDLKDGELRDELFGLLLDQAHLLLVPASTLQVQPMHKAA